MAYGNSNYGRGNYNNNGGYNRSNYQQNNSGFQREPAQPIPFNMDEEITRRLDLFLQISEIAENKGIKTEEIKDYMGGWITSLLIAERDAAKGTR